MKEADLVRAVTPPSRCGAGRCGCWLGASLPCPARFSNWSASALGRIEISMSILACVRVRVRGRVRVRVRVRVTVRVGVGVGVGVRV